MRCQGLLAAGAVNHLRRSYAGSRMRYKRKCKENVELCERATTSLGRLLLGLRDLRFDGLLLSRLSSGGGLLGLGGGLLALSLGLRGCLLLLGLRSGLLLLGLGGGLLLLGLGGSLLLGGDGLLGCSLCARLASLLGLNNGLHGLGLGGGALTEDAVLDRHGDGGGAHFLKEMHVKAALPCFALLNLG